MFGKEYFGGSAPFGNVLSLSGISAINFLAKSVTPSASGISTSAQDKAGKAEQS